MIDTGSPVTLIKKQALGNNDKIYNARTILRSATGDLLPIIGKTMLKLTLPNGKEVEIETVVVGKNTKISTEILVGADFLNQTEATIDFRNQKVMFGRNHKKKAELFESPRFIMHVKEEISLPPYESQIIEAKNANVLDGTYFCNN